MLDMGKPVKILDLAKQMIKFYGYDEKSIPITFIGMRAGEKKQEKLYSKLEKPKKTEYPRIMKINFNKNSLTGVDEIVNKLEAVITFKKGKENYFRNRQILRTIIREFFPSLENPENEPEY